MSDQPSVKKNYIFSLLYQILTMIIPFITAPYVARVLGADGVGIYSYTQSCMTYFTMLAGLGTSSYGMREIARCRDNQEKYSKTFWEIEVLSVFTTTLSIFLWIFFILFSDKYTAYFVALIPMLLATMFDISWFYTGHEKIGYTVVWNALCKILGVVVVFSLIKQKSDLVSYILLNSIILMIGNLSMWIHLPKMLVKVNPRNFEFKRHLKETLIYFIPSIATSIYTVLDKTLIGVITQDEFQNGYYEQANKIINIAKSVVFVSVNKVMEARISFLFVEYKIDEIKNRIEKSMSFILLLGYGVMFGIMATSKDLVPIFFGSGYEPVVYLLYYMSPMVVIAGVSNCLGAHYYTPAGLRKESSNYLIVGSVINLICNLLLIPKYESIGAVIGSLIAETSISILYLINCNQYLTIKQLVKLSYKRIISGIAMYVALMLLRGIDMIGITLLITEIGAGIITYFALLLVLRDELVLEGIRHIKKTI